MEARRQVCGILMLVSLVAEAKPQHTVDVWTRGWGRAYVKILDLDQLPAMEVELVDAQTEQRQRFRGVPLKTLVQRAPRGPGANLALLHFDNGMIIPLPASDEPTWDRLAPFVAIAFRDDGRWATAFPAVPKKDAEARDRRPVRFRGNKVVVKELWHPFVTGTDTAGFSPWRHVDSLWGIEWVEKDAWYGIFHPAATSPPEGGFDVFYRLCQFCHGVRSEGADYGWDYLEPVPLYTYRGPENLFLHVRSIPEDAPEQGLMMPAFPAFTEADARATLAWLESLANAPPGAYAPAVAPK